jgi:uncharacterized protein (UPF0548 family)
MTSPEPREWPPSDHGYCRSEVSAIVGCGDAVWERAARDVLRCRVKTASGFTVDSTVPASRGERVVVTARVSGVTTVESVDVVSVVQESGWVGFAYRTLPGHPVSGEEAFIVQIIDDVLDRYEAHLAFLTHHGDRCLVVAHATGSPRDPSTAAAPEGRGRRSEPRR